MPRTNESKVRNIISTNLESGPVNQFIEDASLWVTEELGTLATPLSAGRLEAIERYLACAFIRLKDLGLKSSTIGDVSENYQADESVTDYLKRAAGLDPSGTVQLAFLLEPLQVAPRQPVQFKVGTGFRDAT